MIMCCMNRTSAGEAGGNVALVDDGSVRVASPGAPGCTTTGVFGLDCCAKSVGDNKHARTHDATLYSRLLFEYRDIGEMLLSDVFMLLHGVLITQRRQKSAIALPLEGLGEGPVRPFKFLLFGGSVNVLISTKGAKCNSLGQRPRQTADKSRSAEGAT